MGGVNPAKEYVEQALKARKHVVTANKELMAKHGFALLQLAAKHHVNLFFEASVAGGIPIIRNLQKSLAANQIHSVYGIINGTTNFILSQMTHHGWSYAEALTEAQKKGYAEADPVADVEGYDAAYKLAVLSLVAFNAVAKISQIHFSGITDITAADIEHARQFGFCIKLLAIGKKNSQGLLELRVGPHLIPLTHPLAAVDGANNAVYVVGDAVGETMFYGPGAGSLPTGSAIVGDVLQLIPHMDDAKATKNLAASLVPAHVLPVEKSQVGYLVRFLVTDQPGVLAAISGIFGKNKVSIENASQQVAGQKTTELMMVTYAVENAGFQKSLKTIMKLSQVKKTISVLPMADL
jgi:homoserine dehydrogenase